MLKNLVVFRVNPFQRFLGFEDPIAPELGQPRRTLRQEHDQHERRDNREDEEYQVDGFPLKKRAHGGGEQHSRRKENAVQRQQCLSVRGPSYLRHVNYHHGRHT